MKASVDKNTCTGCGLCCDTCPAVFEMDGDTARVEGTAATQETRERDWRHFPHSLL